MRVSRFAYAWPLLGAVSLLPACAGVDRSGDAGEAAAADPAYTLQLLFASDLEGDVGAIQDAPNFAALVERFEGEHDNTLILSAGDNYLPGTFFNAASDERVGEALTGVYAELYGEGAVGPIESSAGYADITVMNVIGFDASAVGNHEFDPGDGAFSGIIDEAFSELDEDTGEGGGELIWPGAQFPYLSANLDFENSDLAGQHAANALPSTAFAVNPANPKDTPDLAASTVVNVGGERIGVVGATTQALASISSPGSVALKGPSENDMAALAAILQPEIDELTAQGIDKIVTVTHLQRFALENELVPLLSGVDVAVAGGSDTLLADEDDLLRPGDEAAGEFPVFTVGADGAPAAIVSTDGQYSYVGRLVIGFTENGVLIPDSYDPARSGNYATTAETVAAAYGDAVPFGEGSKGTLVREVTGAVADVVGEFDSNLFGRTSVYLDGRRSEVRTEETNLGNLTADANLAYARSVDSDVAVSLKNGGGIRNAIGTVGTNGELLPPAANPLSGKAEGQVSQLDIADSLRFNNGLTIVELTPDEFLAVVEHGVAATEEGATPGQFPQVGGMTFSFDLSAEPGDRVQYLATLRDDGGLGEVYVEDGEPVPGAPDLKMVTLGFLAGGGDDYPFPKDGLTDLEQPEDAPRTGAATFAPDGSEQDALAEYLAAEHGEAPFDQAETPPAQDERIRNLAATDGSA